MGDYRDRLWDDLANEYGAALSGPRAQQRKANPLRHPRLLASSTVVVVAVVVALVLALSGTAATPPAYAITVTSNGSILVQINNEIGILGANQKLASMGLTEGVVIYNKIGPAQTPGPVICMRDPRAPSFGPRLKVLMGKDGTLRTTSRTSDGSRRPAAYHVGHCTIKPSSRSRGTNSASVRRFDTSTTIKPAR